MEPLTAKEVAAQLNPKEGVDDVWAGEGVVYTRRLTSRATQSRMGRIAGMPFYGQITIRNWRTTERLGGEIGD